MKTEDFKAYLQLVYPDSEATVNTRISNCLKIEKHYGDLDDNFNEDYCNQIIAELSYSKDDENNNRPAIHPIQINGNIRTGSATLKHAVNLYVDFRKFMMSATNSGSHINNFISKNAITSNGCDIRQQLLSIFDSFVFDQILYKDVFVLQQSLFDHLSANITEYVWEMEVQPKTEFRDRVDIFGKAISSDLKIVIELDAHRADQVAKKFLSRTALFADENIVYVSLCYPGTIKMNKMECEKYFNYCAVISEQLSKTYGKEQLYIGYFLN